MTEGGCHPQPCRRENAGDMGLAACPRPRGFAPDGSRLSASPVSHALLRVVWPSRDPEHRDPLQLAAPDRSGVLRASVHTLPADRPALRSYATMLRAIAAELRAEGLVWEFAWIMERSEASVDHAHLLQHGSPVSGARFAAAARRAGAWGDLQPIRHRARGREVRPEAAHERSGSRSRMTGRRDAASPPPERRSPGSPGNLSTDR
jgi:hypothetical protein